MFELFSSHQKHSPDEPIDFETMYIVVDKLGIRGYQAQHFDICKKIWKELVPTEGQATSLQGELLRQIEKLRNEAMDNGNINWDDNFEWFCDHIKEVLISSGIFDDKAKFIISNAMEYIKQCGIYAHKYITGKIPDDEVDPMLFAYTDDDLYNYIEDMIAIFAINKSELIPYEPKKFIYR